MTFADILNILETQFLCCYPINSIKWQEIPSDLSWEDQKLLLDRTYDHQLNKMYPINKDYAQNFLKKLIQHLDQSEEIHDDIYLAFCKLQGASEVDDNKFSYKHYCLSEYGTTITLRESRSFVANGTTGLCSWQASLALSDWLLHNGDIVKGKSVIELGSGTGLCGFIVSKCCHAKKVILTDGSPAVIDVLNTNREINFPSEGDNDRLSIVYLPWEQCELLQARKFDVILAADVVYDSTEFDSLIGAIEHLFRLMEDKVKLVLAATVRNEATLGEFLSLLESKGFTARNEQAIPVETSHLFWDRSTEVRIMTINKNAPSS